MASPIFSEKWAGKLVRNLVSVLSFIVFLMLDFVDACLCIIYRYLDEFFEGNVSSCYCESKEEQRKNVAGDKEGEISETLYGRENVFRKIGLLGFSRNLKFSGKMRGGLVGNVNRWSDCGCESCVSWIKNGDQKLYVVIREPSGASTEKFVEKPAENVIFLHGFLSSSSFWTETVFPNISDTTKQNHRLFAVDLLGFGRSPKPSDCFYTLKDHLEMIEKSVVNPFRLNSFHLVAHSMGCIIALALAAKYSKSVKTITLVAPPYFPSKDGGSLTVLIKLVGKRLWPPLLFGSALMSWYEHLGRCVCFLFCRNHRIWERILKVVAKKRDVDLLIRDLTRHTHHSAWHTMHNVICGGGNLMEGYLEALSKGRVKIRILQGDKDKVVPMECSYNMKIKAPNAEVDIVRNTDHNTIIFGREKELAQNLEHFWSSY